MLLPSDSKRITCARWLSKASFLLSVLAVMSVLCTEVLTRHCCCTFSIWVLMTFSLPSASWGHPGYSNILTSLPFNGLMMQLLLSAELLLCFEIVALFPLPAQSYGFQEWKNEKNWNCGTAIVQPNNSSVCARKLIVFLSIIVLSKVEKIQNFF